VFLLPEDSAKNAFDILRCLVSHALDASDLESAEVAFEPAPPPVAAFAVKRRWAAKRIDRVDFVQWIATRLRQGGVVIIHLGADVPCLLRRAHQDRRLRPTGRVERSIPGFPPSCLPAAVRLRRARLRYPPSGGSPVRSHPVARRRCRPARRALAPGRHLVGPVPRGPRGPRVDDDPLRRARPRGPPDPRADRPHPAVVRSRGRPDRPAGRRSPRDPSEPRPPPRPRPRRAPRTHRDPPDGRHVRVDDLRPRARPVRVPRAEPRCAANRARTGTRRKRRRRGVGRHRRRRVAGVPRSGRHRPPGASGRPDRGRARARRRRAVGRGDRRPPRRRCGRPGPRAHRRGAADRGKGRRFPGSDARRAVPGCTASARAVGGDRAPAAGRPARDTDALGLRAARGRT
jgi:hypothetical protein